MRTIKLFLTLLIFTSIKCLAQSPSPTANIGFEDGTFNHWECFIGHIDSLGNIQVAPSPPTTERQVIYGKESAKLLDPYGKFPLLCPNGGKYSIRLGNKDTGAQAERVTYTFTVPKVKSYSIIFYYAVVLENPSHLPFQQPKFTAKVYDLSDKTYINCPSFDFTASPDLPGFKLSNSKGGRAESIYYKDWSAATIDLSGYTGKSIRLEFTTNDCSRRGHFGYAYLDVNENSESAISGNAYCNGQRSMTLYAPIGFADYKWYDANFTKELGQGLTLTISPPPPDLTQYALKISPYPGLGCVDTLYTTVNKIDEGFKLSVLDSVLGCPGPGVDLTAARVTAGSSAGMTLGYFTDSLATTFLYNPDVVTQSGTYYIQGTNKEGCTNILPIRVTIADPELTVNDPPAVIFPITVDITKAFVHLPNLTYSYYKNEAATDVLANSTAIQYGGNFYIKAVNGAGCATIKAVKVTIYPPSPFVIAAPNTFTPNNDGINDHFIVTVTGIITFGSVNIYNRYGQLVFTTKLPGETWNGNLGGRNLPSGAYYWVFEGTDDYYHKKVNRAGFVTILR
jgi:gliding motility-associated-like protein